MNDNYILIERRLYANGWMQKKIKLNSLGEWEEHTIHVDLSKKQEIIKTPPIYKKTTINEYRDNMLCQKVKYDFIGRTVKRKFYKGEKLTSYTEYKYNSPYTKTKCDLFIMYDTPRNKKCIMKFKYNKEGVKTQELLYYPNGDLAWYADYIYNNQGQITEILTYNNENSLIYKKITTYNSNGDKIKMDKLIHKDYFHNWKPDNGGELGFYLWTDGC